MVADEEHPEISWIENSSLEDERRFSDQLVSIISSALPSLAEDRVRLFFLIPTPAPHPDAEARMINEINYPTEGTGDVRLIMLPRGGRCYVVSAEDRLRALVPLAFRLGPPELTFLASNCTFDQHALESEITDFVLNALIAERPQRLANPRLVAGLHFDSGDLVEVF